MFSKVLFLFMMVLQVASATTITNFDSLHLFRCTFSNKHHNRIVVQDGRIATVVAPEGDISASLEETSGQLFIHALHSNPPVTTISIITESGEVQDIEMIFEDIPSETLVLTPVFEEKFECDHDSCGYSKEQSTSFVVDAVLSGKIPYGFSSVVGCSERRVLKKGVVAEVTGKLISESEIVYIWKINNKSLFSKKINYSDFRFLNPSWIYIDKHQIGGFSGKHTVAMVGVRVL